MARISHNPNSEPKVEDGFLIALAKQGDRNAYNRLVKRYHGFVRLKASSYFLAGGDSDDLIQEGVAGVETILKLKKGEKVNPSIDIPVTIVTKDNVDKFRSLFK